MKHKTVLAILFTLLPLSSALPQTPSPEGTAIKAVRVEKGPMLDGRLDDEVWLKAPVFSGFKMVFPHPGDEPSEKTDLRILFDDTRLYIGVHCLDGEPGRISANSMAHDGDEEGEEDDSVRVLLDPFQDKRYA